MIQYQFFPRSMGITPRLAALVNAFKNVAADISSEARQLSSNQVLATVRAGLESLDFTVETGKRKEAKIDVPVLFGKDNIVDRVFYADALSKDGKIVLEIEAGRATENNQFLKDIFEACMMFNVEYLVLAVRNRYRTHEDFDKIYTFLETLYISNRLRLPLTGILLIGY